LLLTGLAYPLFMTGLGTTLFATQAQGSLVRNDKGEVVGSRFMGLFEPGAITPVNHWGNRFLTSLVNLLFTTTLTDTQAGFKAFRTDVLRRMNLRADRFDIEVDLLLGVLRAGGRVVEVPVSRRSRQFGKSRLNSLLDGMRILRRIVALRMGGSDGPVGLGASQE